MRGFAQALDTIPMALADNSGLNQIEALAEVKSMQTKSNNTRIGIDCMQRGTNGKLLNYNSSLCRYESSTRIRPVDFQEAAIPPSYTTSQDDFKNRRCYYPWGGRRCRSIKASNIYFCFFLGLIGDGGFAVFVSGSGAVGDCNCLR